MFRQLRSRSWRPSVETDEQDFVSSVSTLLAIRQGTGHLRRRIGELDGQMGDVGRALGEKVRNPDERGLTVAETGFTGTEKGRQEYGRRYRDAPDLPSST
jgi:hypothetical protein